ncbi:MAG: ATP-dependent Clp protease ATP-binding subunit [candidate division Zixibacteria bacterium]|jgi:ATP-dependent Clp protease ATP-binding subunit ClpA|nr:ATP-dependent Clp protease ATP-binding subunit [candidate division Zixibacteria bacterium]
MDIAQYSSDARAVIKNAREIAATFRHPEIDVEHLLISTIRHEGSRVESIMNQLGKSRAFIESTVEEYLKQQSKRGAAKENLMISPAVQEVLGWAAEEKAKLYDALVEPEHIFIAIFDPKSRIAGYLREKLDISREAIYNAIAESQSLQQMASTPTTGSGAPSDERPKGEVSGTLRYCTDLTNRAAAGEFDPCIGRDEEVRQVIQILLRRRKNSPVLVGGAGVGKTAIVEGFAQAVIDKRVPRHLEDVRVMELDMGSMVAGAKYKGEFEERFKALIGEVVKSAGKIILFVDEIHMLVGAGNVSGGMDAANLVKPALARGQLRMIGATTEEEYTKYLEKDKAMDRRFEKVKVAEPSFNDCVRIVKGVISKYESHHKISYTEDAIVGAIRFAKRYLSERNLPDIALDIVDEAGSEFSVKEEFAREALPSIEKQIAELQAQIALCDGKDAAKEADAFDKLHTMYDEFSRNVGRLHDFWGHRVEASAGGAK